MPRGDEAGCTIGSRAPDAAPARAGRPAIARACALLLALLAACAPDPGVEPATGAGLPPEAERADAPDVALRLRVEQEIPELADPAVDDLERTSRIRDLLYGEAWWAGDPDVLLDARLDVYGARASDVLAVMHDGGYGVFCGGTAELLRKVYGLFGFSSYAINVGLRETDATHVSTLVRVAGAGGPRWVLQDAYFNFTLTGRDGSPMDFFDAVRLIADRRRDEVLVSYGRSRLKTIVFSSEERYREVKRYFDREGIPLGAAGRHPSGSVLAATELTLDVLRIVAPRYCEFLEARFGGCTLQDLFVFPLAISPGPEAEAILRHWRALAGPAHRAQPGGGGRRARPVDRRSSAQSAPPSAGVPPGTRRSAAGPTARPPERPGERKEASKGCRERRLSRGRAASSGTTWCGTSSGTATG